MSRDEQGKHFGLFINGCSNEAEGKQIQCITCIMCHVYLTKGASLPMKLCFKTEPLRTTSGPTRCHMTLIQASISITVFKRWSPRILASLGRDVCSDVSQQRAIIFHSVNPTTLSFPQHSQYKTSVLLPFPHPRQIFGQEQEGQSYLTVLWTGVSSNVSYIGLSTSPYYY